ncbi:DUF3500 domain-containing protein [Pelagicoccus mobilis]|uniref:DUF3500 domain-containing protein n=1 Tax=Pelagicoccus mobilis TaxID=415221 RepID=A0A934S290_9BACT|nr:DUF3500 domain-containing protein [Pelagicoccus mobilis]MBK1877743.1 DUF3500 domain-containing protein [Pelagicoccus mobilis]
MNPTHVARVLALAVSCLISVPSIFAHEETGERMATAARALIDSVEGDALDRLQREFGENRKNWHFVPRKRDGLVLAEMDETQRGLGLELLRQGLSEQGVRTVEDIRELEAVLQILEGPDRNFERDSEDYHFWIFGEPGAEIWAWRFEGHHASINATVVKGEGVSMTPTFLGANPAEVPTGERRGFRALPKEEDLAFELVESFDAEQRKKAIFDTKAPRDIFTGAHRKAKPLPIEGIAFDELTAVQGELLFAIVDCYLSRNRLDIRDVALARIQEDGWSSVRFGWAGPVDRSKGNYYFVQGKRFLIEYDNTQNGNNHIHCVWREFDGDFGEDLIKAHRDAHQH